jgi:hypothetical protein
MTPAHTNVTALIFTSFLLPNARVQAERSAADRDSLRRMVGGSFLSEKFVNGFFALSAFQPPIAVGADTFRFPFDLPSARRFLDEVAAQIALLRNAGSDKQRDGDNDRDAHPDGMLLEEGDCADDQAKTDEGPASCPAGSSRHESVSFFSANAHLDRFSSRVRAG